MSNLLSHDIFSHTMKDEESIGCVMIQLTTVINNCIYRGSCQQEIISPQ